MCSCGFDGVIVRSKRAHKQEIHIFQRILFVQDGPEDAMAANKSATKGDFGVTLMGLWGHPRVTFGTVWLWGPLWDHCGVTLGI